MIERILKHMNIYREMKNAAIPLNLIGKKGEDSCMNAARLVNQQELSGLMEGLNEETISSLMDDSEILSYLGKMNKKDFPILEPDRIRMVLQMIPCILKNISRIHVILSSRFWQTNTEMSFHLASATVPFSVVTRRW